MAKVNVAVSTKKFIEVYAPMAKEGKSAFEIATALGLKGDKNKVAQSVSMRASQLRKRLQTEGERVAKEKGLDKEATAALIKAMGDKLPRMKSHGRKSEISEIVSALDAVLASLNAPAE